MGKGPVTFYVTIDGLDLFSPCTPIGSPLSPRCISFQEPQLLLALVVLLRDLVLLVCGLILVLEGGTLEDCVEVSHCNWCRGWINFSDSYVELLTASLKVIGFASAAER
jgi:hypothetical protein